MFLLPQITSPLISTWTLRQALRKEQERESRALSVSYQNSLVIGYPVLMSREIFHVSQHTQQHQ